MYSQIAVCLVLVAGAYANGMMGGMNNMMNGMNGMNNMMNGMNGMNGMNNMMNGGMNQMNMLANLLQNGMGQQMGNQMGNQMGMGMGGRGMMSPMMGMMLQALMQQNMGGNNRGDDSSESESESESRDKVSDEDMKKLEDMMKMEFAMEVAQFVMVYQDYEVKMKAFKKAMEDLCLGVEASYKYGMDKNITIDAALEARVDALGERIDSIEDRDGQLNALVEIIGSDEEAFNLGFFKVASMACTTGDEYMKASEKMQRMDDKGDCDECKDKKKK